MPCSSTIRIVGAGTKKGEENYSFGFHTSTWSYISLGPVLVYSWGWAVVVKMRLQTRANNLKMVAKQT